ncbi:coiled-coil-helix-coiled-coil-helix domain containing 6b isoform X2 [Myxocyprinus asiaticus]|uniref:coiled-coil-helix-coiled-coil-helix domain containing 6b isoform X2 n=1 Tax=Myxocyprinus asiaticus TaxID=70543 RepID=UPI0022233A89|nr:coiled-coil-helix-coiled-coil-helix domain containing 6b isoform X2 [Myxocyprinus asiaticus]
MGGSESKTRSVSYGLDEEDNVTVLHGVKLSGDVLQRMRQPGPSPEKPASPKPDPGPPRPSAEDMQEELRRRFEREQALVQEELSRIARREREAAGDDLNPAVLRERSQKRQELEKNHNLTRQLKRKEDELKHLAEFYKEQLQLMEKKNTDHYQQTLQMYNEEAVKAETNIKHHHVTPICVGLQLQVLNCYRENKHQTLQCSQLAKDYMNCINTSKKVFFHSPPLFPPSDGHKYGGCGEKVTSLKQVS